MKRYLHAVAATAIVTSAFGTVGCANRTGATVEDRYRNAVDVSWPERYNYAARESVIAPFGQQAANGHFLDQTIWNFYFFPGTDRLTPGGIDKLDALGRETPSADPKIFIQTARDIVVTADNTDRIAADREELNAKRAAAIKRYMGTQTGNRVPYEVAIHDAPVPGIHSNFDSAAYRGQLAGYKGGISGGTGTLVPGGPAGNALPGTGGQGSGGVGPSGPGGSPGAGPSGPSSPNGN